MTNANRKKELEPMEKIIGLLASISEETLQSMHEDVTEVLEKAELTEFQYNALVEWVAYIEEEMKYRIDECDGDCENCECGGTKEKNNTKNTDPNNKLN